MTAEITLYANPNGCLIRENLTQYVREGNRERRLVNKSVIVFGQISWNSH